MGGSKGGQKTTWGNFPPCGPIIPRIKLISTGFEEQVPLATEPSGSPKCRFQHRKPLCKKVWKAAKPSHHSFYSQIPDKLTSFFVTVYKKAIIIIPYTISPKQTEFQNSLIQCSYFKDNLCQFCRFALPSSVFRKPTGASRFTLNHFLLFLS